MGNCCDSPNEESNAKRNSAVNKLAKQSNPADPDYLQLTITGADVQTVKALFDYEAREPGDLTIIAGEILHIVDNSDQDWWRACKPSTEEKGWVPSNYVALDQSLDAQLWYFGEISRMETDQLLLQPGNKRGTYLVRLSTQRKGAYALSILNHEVESMSASETSSGILHYQIRSLDDGGFYISPRKKFDSLPDLIKYYQGQADGLCYRLLVACPRPLPTMWDISRATRDQWEIPRDTLKMGELLGEGHYGTVYKAKWNGTVDVAVKTLKERMPRDKFLKEAEMMKKLHHRNLLQLFAVVAEGSPVLIITEFMPNGCLLKYLKGNKERFILTQLINIMVQVASGMMYLEAEKFIHRDLAARNVLVGYNMVIKVADFGMARFVPDDFYLAQDLTFPYRWTAPEGIEYNKFSIKSDVWSFGVLMYEILTNGKQPYQGIRTQNVLAYLKKGNRLSCPKRPNEESVPEELYNIMQNCWKMDAESRPTFEYLFNFLEDFLTSIDPSYKDMDTFNVRLSTKSNTSDDQKKTGPAIQRMSNSSSIKSAQGKRYLRALYSYKPNDERELSFNEGDIMEIIDDSGTNWILARHTVNKKMGHVPSNYVELEIH